MHVRVAGRSHIDKSVMTLRMRHRVVRSISRLVVMMTTGAHHHAVRHSVRMVLVMRMRMHLCIEVVSSAGSTTSSWTVHVSQTGVMERIVQLVLIDFGPRMTTNIIKMANTKFLFENHTHNGGSSVEKA